MRPTPCPTSQLISSVPDVGDVQLELEAETPVQSQSQGDEKAQGFLK